MRCNKTASECLSHVVGQQLTDLTQRPYVVVAGSADGSDVGVERESAVETSNDLISVVTGKDEPATVTTFTERVDLS